HARAHDVAETHRREELPLLAGVQVPDQVREVPGEVPVDLGMVEQRGNAIGEVVRRGARPIARDVVGLDGGGAAADVLTDVDLVHGAEASRVGSGMEASPPRGVWLVGMAIYLLRHGETGANAARVVQRAHVPLSARGRAQALRLAERLAKVGIARIRSSDLVRAVETAETLAAATGAPVELDPELAERSYGDVRGWPYA